MWSVVNEASTYQLVEQRRRLRGRAAVVGMAVVGGMGAIAGFVLGLIAYPPTAVISLAELGLLSAIVGAALGFLVGIAISVVRRGPL
jgi:hypothetical protein